MSSIETFYDFSVENIDVVSVERVTALNANFPTRVIVENGNFGRIEGLSQIIQKESGWSRDITDSVRSPAEYRIYRDAKLIDVDIGGRRALVRSDINWFQVDTSDGPTRGLTNMQRIERGHPPLDASGKAVELHHIGQRRDSPLAELTERQHRGSGNDGVLHDKNINSDVHGEGSNWNAEKKKYWEDRANADITRRQTASLTARMAHDAGKREGLHSAMIMGAISTVNNVRDVYNGEITAQEAAINISVDAGTAAALGYGIGFVSSAVATASSASAHVAIRTLGSAGVTAAAISFGIVSYDSVISFAQGEIGGTELANNLGENATGVAGAVAGAKVGAVVGSVAGPVGTVAGGLVGGMVGYVVAVEAYATVIDIATNGVSALTDRAVVAAETAGELREKAVEMGQGVLDFVANNAPEALDTVRTAMNDLASNLKVSLSFR
jgi:hypothetical protein